MSLKKCVFNDDADMKMVQIEKKKIYPDNSSEALITGHISMSSSGSSVISLVATIAIRISVAITASWFIMVTAATLLHAIPAECEESPPALFSPAGKSSNNQPEPITTPSAIPQDGIPSVQPQKKEVSPAAKEKSQELTSVFILTKGVMCERIKGFEPEEPAVLFSISLGKIYCFTAFENISHNTFIYHKWFHRDRFVATNRFLVKAPQWSTFSTMQLRVADKGPWRVEITDDKNNLLKTLRFSVSD